MHRAALCAFAASACLSVSGAAPDGALRGGFFSAWSPSAIELADGPVPELRLRFFSPLAADAATGATEKAAPPADAVAGASEAAPGGFLFFPDKVTFHKVVGWTSGGLLLAAGVVGAVRAYTLMSDGHAYRDSLGITEETMGSACSDEIASLWSDSGGQALRWTHVGLLAAGESLYLANAATGISMFTPDGPGLTRSDIHRYAFFVHAGLMIAEAVLGVMTTEALRRGDHEAVSEALGPAHVAIGFAIPGAIFAAGALIETGWFADDN